MNKDLIKLMNAINLILNNITYTITDITIRYYNHEYIIMLQFDNKYHVRMKLNYNYIVEYHIEELATIMLDYINIELYKIKS